ncbi:excinuclease ABC subunit UvrA [Chitinophaga sp.]|uniref:excinuclease ABC subunit UvrA n=1 Tax=Chitinophaga sp. TaxID=1869181 RepID=UPI0031CEA5F2
MKTINISGARQNNLKNISLKIPKNKITVFTGVSGSGKSSLVFETIGAEAQRQINETQHSFIRNRLQHFGVADVEKIENLNVPVIINQKRIGGNARSTVGTITDIYSHLRLLYARMGEPFIGYSNAFSFNNPQGMCKRCDGLGKVNTVNVDKLINKEKSLNEGAVNFPSFQPGGWRWTRYVYSGYFDNDKKLKDYTPEEWQLLLYAEEHKPPRPGKEWGKTVMYEGVIARIERSFLNKESAEFERGKAAIRKVIREETCPRCHGARLNEAALSCKINNRNIADCTKMQIDELLAFVNTLHSEKYETVIGELRSKLAHLVAIGLPYLSLGRETATLSGGESQRIKMVKHLGNSLVDLLYIFDEPSIGLHPQDVDNLTHILQRLRDKGNTILVVEHDPDVIRIADHVVDMGPRAGTSGGRVIYEGSYAGLAQSPGLTGAYFSKPKQWNMQPRSWHTSIPIRHANLFNLQNISVDIPEQIMTVVTGVAGSGKSTLINKVLPAAHPHASIIDQSMFTASVRSNLLSFLGIADDVRLLFGKENRVRSGLFSSNSEGACPECKGLGVLKIDLAFMEDVEEPCDSCGGSGFSREALQYLYHGKNIAEVLAQTVEEAILFFGHLPLVKPMQQLSRLGLDYITLGQRLSTFSGGERQRLKLSGELESKQGLLVLDEPTTGLHPSDIGKLMEVINTLVVNKNTVIVIEHNLDVIAQADWIIDLGPGAGAEGGRVMFEGTVEGILECEASVTGRCLQRYLSA